MLRFAELWLNGNAPTDVSRPRLRMRRSAGLAVCSLAGCIAGTDGSSPDAGADFASEQSRPGVVSGDSDGAALEPDASAEGSDGPEGDTGLVTRLDECGRTLAQKNSSLYVALERTDDPCLFRLEAAFADLDVAYLWVTLDGASLELSMQNGFVLEEQGLRLYGAACDALASPDAGSARLQAREQPCPVREPSMR